MQTPASPKKKVKVMSILHLHIPTTPTCTHVHPHPPPLQIVYGRPCRHARSDSSLRIFSSGCSFQRSPYRLLFIDVSPGAPSPRSCSVHLAGLSSLIAPRGLLHQVLSLRISPHVLWFTKLCLQTPSRAFLLQIPPGGRLLADPHPGFPGAFSPLTANLKGSLSVPWRLPPLHLRTHHHGALGMGWTGN